MSKIRCGYVLNPLFVSSHQAIPHCFGFHALQRKEESAIVRGWMSRVEEDTHPEGGQRIDGEDAPKHRGPQRVRRHHGAGARQEFPNDNGPEHGVTSDGAKVGLDTVFHASRTNSLKDYINIAGPYGVTHIILFTKMRTLPRMRIGCFPQGPTLHFRVWLSSPDDVQVEEYTLIRDLLKTSSKGVDTIVRFLLPCHVVALLRPSHCRSQQLP